ncbi:MAG: hypothetical protein U0524_02535 [Candidatus Saccharimonadales bacterium]
MTITRSFNKEPSSFFWLDPKEAKDQGRTLILGDGCRLAQWVQQLTR